MEEGTGRGGWDGSNRAIDRDLEKADYMGLYLEMLKATVNIVMFGKVGHDFARNAFDLIIKNDRKFGSPFDVVVQNMVDYMKPLDSHSNAEGQGS